MALTDRLECKHRTRQADRAPADRLYLRMRTIRSDA